MINFKIKDAYFVNSVDASVIKEVKSLAQLISDMNEYESLKVKSYSCFSILVFFPFISCLRDYLNAFTEAKSLK